MIEMMKYEVVWAKYNTWGNQDEKFHGKSILITYLGHFSARDLYNSFKQGNRETDEAIGNE